MRFRDRAVAVVLATALSGCYAYVPAEMDTVPGGTEVRVSLNRVGVAHLDELGVAEDLLSGREASLIGVLLRREGGRLALQVPVAGATGSMSRAILQEVPLDAADVRGVEIRRLDRTASVLAAAAAVGAGTAIIVFIIGGAERNARLPPPGGPDDARIPTLP